jgi:hypothetical protein
MKWALAPEGTPTTPSRASSPGFIPIPINAQRPPKISGGHSAFVRIQIYFEKSTFGASFELASAA